MTIPNIPIDSYNCGGFALNTFNWFCPFDEDYEDRCNRISCKVYNMTMGSRQLFQQQLLQEESSYILKKIPLIQVVSDPHHISKGKNLIAYRNGIFWDETFEEFQYDFHFKIRYKGKWYEKQGKKEIKTCRLNPYKDWKTGGAIYNSSIVYFCY